MEGKLHLYISISIRKKHQYGSSSYIDDKSTNSPRTLSVT